MESAFQQTGAAPVPVIGRTRMDNRQSAAAAKKIRIVVADDHAIVRAAVGMLLSQICGVEVIAEAATGDELIKVVTALEPDVAMTDLSMSDTNGFAAISTIHHLRPQVRLLVLSMPDTVDHVRRAIASGACGYLRKDAPALELEQAIRSVMTVGAYFSPTIAQMLLQAPPSTQDELTPRQYQVLKLLVRGRAPKEIGYELGLSARTVDVHRAHIMERLQLKELASLTRYAIRKGLLET